jgi:hypothetical protein
MTKVARAAAAAAGAPGEGLGAEGDEDGEGLKAGLEEEVQAVNKRRADTARMARSMEAV